MYVTDVTSYTFCIIRHQTLYIILYNVIPILNIQYGI